MSPIEGVKPGDVIVLESGPNRPEKVNHEVQSIYQEPVYDGYFYNVDGMFFAPGEKVEVSAVVPRA